MRTRKLTLYRQYCIKLYVPAVRTQSMPILQLLKCQKCDFQKINHHKQTIVHKPETARLLTCLLYTSPSPRDGLLSRMPSSA